MNYQRYLLSVILCMVSWNMNAAQYIQILVDPEELSVKRIFDEIEKQTSYTIGYTDSDLDLQKTIYLPALKYDLDKLLILLLKDTKFHYTIRENHILIVPYSEKSTQANEEKAYRGKVLCAHESAVLSYATVRLLSASQEVLATGVTNENGEFTLFSSDPVAQVQVSFIGYVSQTKAGEEFLANKPVFRMQIQVRELDETVVSSHTDPLMDRTVFLITAEKKEKSGNALDLLQMIPQIKVDPADHVVYTGKNETVLLLVDGIQKSQEYIKGLNPERVLKVELIHEPSGRFVSDNYSVLINFILKKDYSGYEVNMGNSMQTNFSGTNGAHWLMREHPELNLTFTRNNITWYAHYNHERTRLNLSHYRSLNYGNPERLNFLRAEHISINDPNHAYKNQLNHWVTGVGYDIGPRHKVTFQYDYTVHRTSSDYSYQLSNFPEYHPDDYLFNDTSITKLKDTDYVLSAFYKGFINENFKLYGDFSYNRYVDNVYNYYQYYLFYTDQNIFKEKKNQLSFNLEGDIQFNPLYTLITGYSTHWREYDSNSFTGAQFIDYQERRSDLFLYLIGCHSESLQTKIGGTMEFIHTRSMDYQKKQLVLQPYIMINCRVNEAINLNFSYTTNMDRPNLNQLSIMPLAYDSVVTQKGNPTLETSLNHLFSTRLSYKDRFYLKGEYKFSPKGITESLEEMDHWFYLTYTNARVQQYALQADYYQPFNENLTWRNSVIYYWNRMKHKEVSNHLDGWLLDSQLDYYNSIHNWGIQLGYHRRMDKNILWQGYQMSNMDKWEVTVRKFLWNRQWSLMLSYILPVDWGVRYRQLKIMDNPRLLQENYTDLKTYRNTLFLKAEFRFNKGKSRSGTPSVEYNGKDRRRLGY